MTVVDMPNIPWNQATWSLERDDLAIRLQSGAEVFVQARGARWSLSLPVALRTRAQVRELQAALFQLAKFGNTFLAGPPDYELSTGYGGSTPLVNGSGQFGVALQADGVAASTLIADRGDFIGVSGQVLMLVAPAESDGSGNVTFEFEPALREAPDDDAHVEMYEPRAEFRLRDPEATAALNIAKLRTLSIDAVETWQP